MKKATGWIALIAGYAVLGIVFDPPLASREWLILIAASSLFAISGSIFTAAKVDQWPWDFDK